MQKQRLEAQLAINDGLDANEKKEIINKLFSTSKAPLFKTVKNNAELTKLVKKTVKREVKKTVTK